MGLHLYWTTVCSFCWSTFLPPFLRPFLKLGVMTGCPALPKSLSGQFHKSLLLLTLDPVLTSLPIWADFRFQEWWWCSTSFIQDTGHLCRLFIWTISLSVTYILVHQGFKAIRTIFEQSTASSPLCSLMTSGHWKSGLRLDGTHQPGHSSPADPSIITHFLKGHQLQSW